MDRTFPFSLALKSLLCTVAVMFLCLVVLHLDTQIPLALACVVAVLFALRGGGTLRQAGEGVLRSLRQALTPVCILLLIGALTGVWMAAGVVPAMVLCGLRLLSPRLFPACAMLICGLLSMVLGSWGTAGTVGLALMGIARAMGLPAPLAAGAVISGCYVGDKLSPLADTTNLAAAAAGIPVMENIRHVARISVLPLLLCLGAYGLLGLGYGGETDALAGLDAFRGALEAAYPLSLFRFLPLLAVIVCVLCGLSALPALGAGIAAGLLVGLFTGAAPAGELLRSLFTGCVGRTGLAQADSLLTAGGVLSMLPTISIVVLAMSFGGIMESTGQIHALIRPVAARARGLLPLVGLTVSASICTNILLPDQYIAIALPGKMLSEAYDSCGVPRRELAMSIGIGGALTSALVPWNTCGVFMSGVLGVATGQYLPWAFYNWLMPLCAVLYAVLRRNRRT